MLWRCYLLQMWLFFQKKTLKLCMYYDKKMLVRFTKGKIEKKESKRTSKLRNLWISDCGTQIMFCVIYIYVLIIIIPCIISNNHSWKCSQKKLNWSHFRYVYLYYHNIQIICIIFFLHSFVINPVGFP